MHVFFNILHCVIVAIFGKEFCEGCSENIPEIKITKAQVGGLILKGEIKNMELREGQQVTVSAELTTKKGNPASYQKGSATFESSNEDVATVEQNPENELEAVVKGVDGSENEAVVITFRVDGDPDDDESRDIVGSLDVVVTQGEATVVSLKTGEVSDSEETETEA